MDHGGAVTGPGGTGKYRRKFPAAAGDLRAGLDPAAGEVGGDNGAALRRTLTADADRFAVDLAPVIAAIRAEGHTSLRAVAAELNALGMLTRRGGRWQVSNVRGLLDRL